MQKNSKGFIRKTDNKLRGKLGETDFNKGLIRVNKKKARKAGKGEVIRTIVHEEMHVDHPKMKEKNVEKGMQKKVNRLSPKMKRAYYNLYK